MKKNNKVKSDKGEPVFNTKLYLLFLVLVPLVLYFRVVNFEFSNLDDTNIIIAQYETIGDLKNIKEAFTHDAFMSNAGDAYYRPMQTISFMIDAQIGGKLPWIYHLTNLLIHILTVIALFFFLKKIGIKKEISFVLALFFSVHPLFTHAVAWIPARGDLLLGLFSLLSFLTFLEFMESKRTVYFILHAFLFILALFSKETVILLPLLILSWFYFAGKNKFVLKDIMPYVAVWGLSFVLFYYLRQDVVRVKNAPNIFGIEPFINNLPVIPITFGKFFLPFNLSTLPFFDITYIITGVILILTFAIVTIKYRSGEGRIIIWGVLWFLAFTIPPMLIRNYNAEIGYEYFEYRAYLPMIGILLIIGLLGNRLSVKFTFNSILKVSVPVLFVYGFLAFIHSTAFKDPVSFFTDALDASSKNAMALNSRGCLYSDAGRMDQAIKDFDNAISVSPVYSTPYYNKADVYKTIGDDSRAEEYYSLALKYDTLYPNTNILMDNAYISLSAEKIILKKYEEALIILNKAKIAYPLSYKIFNNAGYVYSMLGRYDSALTNFSSAIKLAPNTASYYNNRAKAKYHLKDFNGSFNDFNKALELDHNLTDAYLNRGIAKIDMNDFNGAISDLNMAISLDSQSGEAYYYRGTAYSKMNKPGEAAKDWEEARKLGFSL
jgi:protein O-mannosyl-transferase